MNRLTEKHYKSSDGYYMKCRETCHKETCGCCEGLDNIVDRLGQIEDILGDTYDLDRLRELVEADKAGQVAILPCVPGSTVYQITVSRCKWREIDKCDSYCSGYGDCWEGEQTVEPVKFEPWMIAYMGKTVFLTEQAAQAALKGGTDQ